MVRSAAYCKRFDARRQRATHARQKARVGARENPEHAFRGIPRAGRELQSEPVRKLDSVVRGQRGQRPSRGRAQLCSTEFADALMRVDQRRERALRVSQFEAHPFQGG